MRIAGMPRLIGIFAVCKERKKGCLTSILKLKWGGGL